MAIQRPLDTQYGLTVGGSLVIDRERNLAVENASIKNLTVTGTLTAVTSTDTYVKDNNILLNSGVEAGAVSTLGTITGGSNYTSGSYKNVPLSVSSGTAGVGATADITVNASGAVSVVTIKNSGYGYATDTVFTVAAADIDSDASPNGSGFSVPVTAVTAGSAATDAFITVARGTTGADVAIKWDETTSDRWQLTNDGTNYYGIYVTNDATTSATANKLVLRDGSGNISVNDIGASAGTFSGDIAVNGGDITTTSTGTATVFNTNATTVNIGGAADTIAIGKPSTSTVTVNNLTINGTLSVPGGISGSLSNSTTSTQSGYFGNIYLYDDSTPSNYLEITNSANLTATRTLSVDVNDANRTVSLSGDLTLANNFSTSGAFALTLTTTGATNVTLPTSGTLATTGNLSQFAATSSSQLAGIISDETGTGSLVFATSPEFTTSVSVASGTTTFDVFNVTSTTINAFGAATSLSIAHTGTTARTVNIATGATGGASTLTFGGAVSGNSLKIASTTSGTANLTTDVTTGTANIFTSVTGKVQVGAANSELYVGTETAFTGTTTTVATVSQTPTDLFSTTEFRSAEYLVQITQGSSYQLSKVLLVHDGTTAYLTEYGTVASGTILGTLDADISGGNVRLLVTMGSATSAVVKVSRKNIIV